MYESIYKRLTKLFDLSGFEKKIDRMTVFIFNDEDIKNLWFEFLRDFRPYENEKFGSFIVKLMADVIGYSYVRRYAENKGNTELEIEAIEEELNNNYPEKEKLTKNLIAFFDDVKSADEVQDFIFNTLDNFEV